MTVLELTRVERITKTYTLATLFPNMTGPFATAGIAILPRRVNPVGGTVFQSLTITGGAVTVTYAGPDASSSGAVVVTGSGDAHIEVTTADGQVDTAKAETLLMAGGSALIAMPPTYVTSVNGMSGAVTIAGGGGGGVSVVDNGDGTFTLSGSAVTDNGDGTFTIAA